MRPAKQAIPLRSIACLAGEEKARPKGLAFTDKRLHPHEKKAVVFKWWYDSYFKGRFQTHLKNDHGLKQKDWGASGHNFTLPIYARFSRKGDHFTLQIREEKKSKWTTLFEETTPLPKSLLIGPYMFQTVSLNPNMFYYAQFDKIKIQ